MAADFPRPDPAVAAGPPPSDPTEPERELERAWKALSELGRHAFSTGDLRRSIACHRQALARADIMFDLAWRGGTPLLAPMLYNISCANLADAITAEGSLRPDGADLLIAYDKLVDAAASTVCPLALRINCLRHLRWSIAIFARQVDAGPGDARVDAMLSRTSAIARQISTIVSRVGTPADDVPPHADRLH